MSFSTRQKLAQRLLNIFVSNGFFNQLRSHLMIRNILIAVYIVAVLAISAVARAESRPVDCKSTICISL